MKNEVESEREVFFQNLFFVFAIIWNMLVGGGAIVLTALNFGENLTLERIMPCIILFILYIVLFFMSLVTLIMQVSRTKLQLR